MLKNLRIDDIKEENIDILKKEIIIQGKPYQLSYVIQNLYSQGEHELLRHLKKELMFRLRLFGFNGYEINNYLENVGYNVMDLMSY